ncbi:MAG: hypothetical protein J1E97_02630, partial [Muribaculaceae bacterium]|nr:hypothetical protein [Muribaculaceae bacterium]
MKISKGKAGAFSLLRHKKYRQRDGAFLVQGRKAVTDSLSTFTPIAFVVDSGSDEFEFLAELGVAIYEASQAEMQKISTLENVPEIV